MAEAEGLGLAGEGDFGETGDGAGEGEEGGFVFGGEGGFELGGGVEVVLHGGLAAGGDDDDLGAAGGYGLLHAVLDEGLVDEAEHLLGGGLGGGEEAGAEAGGGEDGFADFLGGHVDECALGGVIVAVHLSKGVLCRWLTRVRVRGCGFARSGAIRVKCFGVVGVESLVASNLSCAGDDAGVIDDMPLRGLRSAKQLEWCGGTRPAH